MGRTSYSISLVARQVRFYGLRSVLLAIFSIAISACSTVKVDRKAGETGRVALQSANLLEATSTAATGAVREVGRASIELLNDALRFEAIDAPLAAARYLKSAVKTRHALALGTTAPNSEAGKALLSLHNSSLSRFAELWMNESQDATSGNGRFENDGEVFELSISPQSTYQPAYFNHVIATSSLRKKGLLQVERAGLGASLVGTRKYSDSGAPEMLYYSPKGLQLPVTMTLDSVESSTGGPTRIIYSLRNPALEPTVILGKTEYPTSADFSAPIALMLNRQNQDFMGLQGFFDAKEQIAKAGIYLTSPYDPDRIPVILIHGLISVPMIWRDIFPQMMSDPEIAKRYQFMVFSYPSGLPIPESAALLRTWIAGMREDLDPDGNDPLSKNMIVVGHSMGGILTRSLVTDVGENLWKQFNETPLDQLDITPERRERIRRMVYFSPDPAINRVVYFSTPHRGSKLAEKSLAGALSKIAKLPLQAVNATTAILDPRVAENVALTALQNGTYTSAQSLAPGAPMTSALEMSPVRAGVTYHSVIGDRGLGDTPHSSDGIVDYWSSHLDGAASELIVPTGHRSYLDPQSIQELKRILRLHAGISE